MDRNTMKAYSIYKLSLSCDCSIKRKVFWYSCIFLILLPWASHLFYFFDSPIMLRYSYLSLSYVFYRALRRFPFFDDYSSTWFSFFMLQINSRCYIFDILFFSSSISPRIMLISLSLSVVGESCTPNEISIIQRQLSSSFMGGRTAFLYNFIRFISASLLSTFCNKCHSLMRMIP